MSEWILKISWAVTLHRIAIIILVVWNVVLTVYVVKIWWKGKVKS